MCIENTSIPVAVSPLEAALRFLRRVKQPARLLIAISGGSDSCGLLIAMHRALAMAPCNDISLYAVTIDHALRPASAQEAETVAALCAGLGIGHFTRRWEGTKPSSGLSAASRMARYRLIGDVADEIGATAILTAHTQNDQHETVAMRAARSARADNAGLAGMADSMLYAGHHWVLRPFLQCQRQDIRDFLAEAGHGWIDDPSNIDRKYERVRTRFAIGAGDIVPALQADAADRQKLSGKAAGVLRSYGHGMAGYLVRIETQGLAADPSHLRHALSGLSAAIGGRRYGLASASMDRVMDFVRLAKPGRMTAARVVFDLRRDGLYLMRENRDLPLLSLMAGESAIWDGRYRVINTTNENITVRAAEAATAADAMRLFPDVPGGVALRAARSMPELANGQTGQALTRLADIRFDPVLAPYDLFLPGFDLELACEIASLMAARPYPQPPV